MPLTLVHHRFTVDDYEQMIEHGILTENDRVELIRGEIIEKMSIGDPHAARVKRLNRLLSIHFGTRAIISGAYDDIRVLRRGDSIEIAAFSGLALAVDEII